MPYLKWDEKKITNFSDENINIMYNHGFVFTRVDKGVINQTRSIRICLSIFELSSENRRILRKTEGLKLFTSEIPYKKYDWTIGKLGKDFYTKKFGNGVFSANKIKEMLTDDAKTNFNKLLIYGKSIHVGKVGIKNFSDSEMIGYCITCETNNLLHYCYPFYNLSIDVSNLGMSMMIRAILWAKNNKKEFVYLGSFQRQSDIYKLQFAGMEWFDGKNWQTNLKKLKEII